MFLQRVLQLLLCSIVMQNIQIFYGGPAMFIVIYLFPCFQTRNFLPNDWNTIIKQHLHGEELLSLLSLLQVDIFEQKLGILQQIILKACIRPFQVISPKVLQESTTILHLKVYIFYVTRKLVGHPPWQECTLNLALFLFPFVCNARSLNHQFFLFFPMKFYIVK